MKIENSVLQTWFKNKYLACLRKAEDVPDHKAKAAMQEAAHKLGRAADAFEILSLLDVLEEKGWSLHSKSWPSAIERNKFEIQVPIQYGRKTIGTGPTIRLALIDALSNATEEKNAL